MKIKPTSNPAVYTIEITASRRELQALQSVMGCVLGSTEGPRGACDDFYYAIDELLGTQKTCTYEPAGANLTMPDTWEQIEKDVAEAADSWGH